MKFTKRRTYLTATKSFADRQVGYLFHSGRQRGRRRPDRSDGEQNGRSDILLFCFPRFHGRCRGNSEKMRSFGLGIRFLLSCPIAAVNRTIRQRRLRSFAGRRLHHFKRHALYAARAWFILNPFPWDAETFRRICSR